MKNVELENNNINKLLFANIKYKLKVNNIKPEHAAKIMKIHKNAFLNKCQNPLKFKLNELIELQKLLNEKSFNDMLCIDDKGNITSFKLFP